MTIINPSQPNVPIQFAPGPQFHPASFVLNTNAGPLCVIVGGVPKEAPLAAEILCGLIAGGELKLGDDPTRAIKSAVAAARGILAECVPAGPAG